MDDREARERLERIEARFRATFEQAAVGMALVAPDRTLLRVNYRYCALLGYAARELIEGKRVDEIIHPDDFPECEAQMRRLVAGEIDTYTTEVRFLRADGDVLWGRDTVSLVRDASGEPDYFVCVLVDISERVEAESRLRDSEELFRSTFEQAAVGMALAGRPWEKWIRANQRFCDILGYPCDELIGMTSRDVTHPDDREEDLRQSEDLVSGRTDSVFREKRYVRKDGSVVWVERTAKVVRGPDGEPAFYLIIIQDITDRKKAEERLRDSERRFRLLFENANESIALYRVVRDEEDKVVDIVVEDVNPEQVRGSGLPREAVVGRSLHELYGGLEAMRPYVEMAEGIVREGSAQSREIEFAPAGVHYLASVYPLANDLWAAMGMDITDIRRAQEELKRKDEAIRQAYEDVLDAVTGGKLVLLAHEEMEHALGEPLSEERVITAPTQLAEARHNVSSAVGRALPSLERSMRVLNPLGEALNNALKHAGGGRYRVFLKDGTVQVRVSDSGPGIDFRSLPKAALLPGYSTTATLGMGFTIMLQMADRLLLSTQPGDTTLVIEVSEERPG